jgi:hypothetical protein
MFALFRQGATFPPQLSGTFTGRWYFGRMGALTSGRPGDAMAYRFVVAALVVVLAFPVLGARAAPADVPENWRSTLVGLGKWNTLPRARSLALSAYLASDALAESLSPEDLFKLRTHFAAEHFEEVLASGLAADAIAFWNGLPQTIRETLTSEPREDIEVTLDGSKISISTPQHPSDLRLALTAAHIANGDIQTARSVAPWWPLIGVRLVLSCWSLLSGGSWLGALAPVCIPIVGEDEVRKAALLDLTLNRPDADAFDYVEVFHGLRNIIDSSEMIWGLVLCKRLEHTGYKRYCDQDREHRAWGVSYAVESHTQPDSNGMIPIFDEAHAGRLDSLVNAFQAKLVAVAAQYSDVLPMRQLNPERLAGPLPSPFAERPLPPQFLRSGQEGLFESPGLPPDHASLPEGYLPVRIEQDGDRVVIISVSQNLDPTGEHTRGGYWVHVSSDRGKSWQHPLYTGLAERFPYLVLNSSAMPLIAGDTLNVEVRIEQIGRALVVPAPSIPSTRSESGLYLEIPLALLRADKDRDGISDIVETRLLLDPENPDTDGDALTDGADPMPNVRRGPFGTPIQDVMGRIVERVSRRPKKAIIGPLEVPKASPNPLEDHFARALFGEPLSPDSPILVAGKATDYAGFNPSRTMLVYDDDQLSRIRRMNSEVRPLWLSEVILNRGRTRGFVNWAAGGFTGGTFQLNGNGTRWTIRETMRWYI